MGRRQRSRRGDNSAGGAPAPSCAAPPCAGSSSGGPAGEPGGCAVTGPEAIISERLAALAALDPEPCHTCRERRSNGPGWSWRCTACFGSTHWRELLGEAPRPSGQLAKALCPGVVQERLRQAQDGGGCPGLEQVSDDVLMAEFAAHRHVLSAADWDKLLCDTRMEHETAARKRLLAARLARAGVGEIAVPGDGSCQYAAAATALYGTSRYSGALRAATHHYIWERRGEKEYAPWVSPEYLAALERDGWGDILTLQAIAHVTGSALVVATAEPGRWVETKAGDGAAAGRVGCLTLNAVHYNAALPAENGPLGGACQAAEALEGALAAVRAAADAGKGMGAAEGKAAEVIAGVTDHYSVDPELWHRALAAARRPQQSAPAPSPASSAPGLLGELSAAEAAARQRVAHEQDQRCWELRVAAERAARSAVERALGRRVREAERRAGDARESRGAAADKQRAAEERLEAAEERLGAAQREAEAQRESHRATEAALSEAREALSAARQGASRPLQHALEGLARAAHSVRESVSVAEAARRGGIRAAAELRGCKAALRVSVLAAQCTLREAHGAVRCTLADSEQRERQLLAQLCRSGAARAAAAAQERRRLAESEARERGLLQQAGAAEWERVAAAAAADQNLLAQHQQGPRVRERPSAWAPDREGALRLQESLARAALRQAADRELVQATVAMLTGVAAGPRRQWGAGERSEKDPCPLCADAAALRVKVSRLSAQLRAARLAEPPAREEQTARGVLGAATSRGVLGASSALSSRRSQLTPAKAVRRPKEGRASMVDAEPAPWRVHPIPHRPSVAWNGRLAGPLEGTQHKRLEARLAACSSPGCPPPPPAPKGSRRRPGPPLLGGAGLLRRPPAALPRAVPVQSA